MRTYTIIEASSGEDRFISLGDTFEEAREAMEERTGLQIPNPDRNIVSIEVWEVATGEAVQVVTGGTSPR